MHKARSQAISLIPRVQQGAEVLTPLQERELSWHCPGQSGVASEVRPVRHESAAAAHRAYQGSIPHWMSQGRVHSCTRSSTIRRSFGIRQDTSLRRQW